MCLGTCPYHVDLTQNLTSLTNKSKLGAVWEVTWRKCGSFRQTNIVRSPSGGGFVFTLWTHDDRSVSILKVICKMGSQRLNYKQTVQRYMKWNLEYFSSRFSVNWPGIKITWIWSSHECMNHKYYLLNLVMSWDWYVKATTLELDAQGLQTHRVSSFATIQTFQSQVCNIRYPIWLGQSVVKIQTRRQRHQ